MRLVVKYWMNETMISYIMMYNVDFKNPNMREIIIHSKQLFSNTLPSLGKKRRKPNVVWNTAWNVNKRIYKPKYQMRASLCHVIKREHTNIKHLSGHLEKGLVKIVQTFFYHQFILCNTNTINIFTQNCAVPQWQIYYM